MLLAFYLGGVICDLGNTACASEVISVGLYEIVDALIWPISITFTLFFGPK